MLSVVMCTARKSPGYKQLADSLFSSSFLSNGCVRVPFELIVVDEGIWYREKEARQELADAVKERFPFIHVAPKPNVWRGPTKLTKKDHWNKQSALNTGVCYANYNRVAFLDDNAIVGRGWIQQHNVHLPEKISLAGAYMYWHPGIKVVDCHIIKGNPHVPGDHRLVEQDHFGPCQPGWLYGGNCSFDLETILLCNGWDEILAGSGGLEDAEFSVRASRVSKTFFNPACIVNYLNETNEVVGDYISKAAADIYGSQQTENPSKCKGFWYVDHIGTRHWFTWNHVPIWLLTAHEPGKHPTEENAFVAVYNPRLEKHRSRYTTIGNNFNLRELRKTIKSGGSFPIPTSPTVDWRDKQPLETF